VMCLSTGYHPR